MILLQYEIYFLLMWATGVISWVERIWKTDGVICVFPRICSRCGLVSKPHACILLLFSVTCIWFLYLVAICYQRYNYRGVLTTLKFNAFAFYTCIRRMEEILDAFADRVSKPRLFITDKMQIALGKLSCCIFIAECAWVLPHVLSPLPTS